MGPEDAGILSFATLFAQLRFPLFLSALIIIAFHASPCLRRQKAVFELVSRRQHARREELALRRREYRAEDAEHPKLYNEQPMSLGFGHPNPR